MHRAGSDAAPGHGSSPIGEEPPDKPVFCITESSRRWLLGTQEYSAGQGSREKLPRGDPGLHLEEGEGVWQVN